MHWRYLMFIFVPLFASTSEYVWTSTATLPHETKEKVSAWLSNGMNATQSLFGALPQKKLYFTIRPLANANEPVPWGQVSRDGKNTITLHVDTSTTQERLLNDWTLYHEIAHLYLPFLDERSTWISEGFATYIQNISMLNHGVISQKEYTERVNAGLTRGRINANKVIGAIENVSEQMRTNRAYMRIYWTGVAFFINVDNALQAQGTDLITVISAYASCCLTPKDSGEALMRQLDKVSETNVFSNLHTQYIAAEAFPEIQMKNIIQLSHHYFVPPTS